MIISIIILLIISAICKAIMDIITYKYDISIFSNLKRFKNWFNPNESWRNKYKDRDPQKGKAFFGSTTFLVWITDAWHFFQMIMLSSFMIAIILPINLLFPYFPLWKIITIDLILFLIMKLIYGTIFEIFWKKIFLKKK